jgi:hypothetical protein
MSDDGPENLTLRYLRSIAESRLEVTVTRGFEVVAARLTGIEGRFIAIEGRLAALEAWSSDTSITPVAHGAGRIENLSTTANPATGQAHA